MEARGMATTIQLMCLGAQWHQVGASAKLPPQASTAMCRVASGNTVEHTVPHPLLSHHMHTHGVMRASPVGHRTPGRICFTSLQASRSSGPAALWMAESAGEQGKRMKKREERRGRGRGAE
eukprot:1149447-Pelagomonas_calceolata.AAC.1